MKNAGYSTLTVSALQGKAGNRTTALLHLLVEHHADEQRERALGQQLVGVRILREAQRLGHDCRLDGEP